MDALPKHYMIERFTKTCCKTGCHNLHELLTETVCRDKEIKMLALTIGPPNEKETLTVLLLGETGAGKTHLLNALVNMVLGVDHSDDFRFKVRDQVEGHKTRVDSQTDYITSYLIYHVEGMPINCNLRIIDTPGFGDTKYDCNEPVTERLSLFLKGDFGIDYLHCIGLVEKATNNKISRSRLDILNAFSSLLSRDVCSVTKLLATFAVDENQVEEVVRAAGIPISGVYEFDNWPLYKDRTQKNYNSRWNTMQEELTRFLEELCEVSPVYVENIRLLNTERKRFEETKSLLREELKKVVSEKRVYDELEKILNNFQEEAKSEKFHKNKDNNTIEKIDKVVRGSHAHNCKTCHMTCLTCKNPSNIEALRKGLTTGANMSALGLQVGLRAHPAAGATAGVIGAVAGLAVGMVEEWKTAFDCPKASSNELCLCCNLRLSEHSVESTQFTNKEKMVEKAYPELETKYQHLMEAIKETEELMNSHNRTTEHLFALATTARIHLQKIRELSMESDPLTLENFLTKMMAEEMQHPDQNDILDKLIN